MTEKSGSRPALLLLLAGTAFLLCFSLGRTGSEVPRPLPVRPGGASHRLLEQGFSGLVDRTRPALVSVNVETRTRLSTSGVLERFRRQLFPGQEPQSRNASGFVVRGDGCIVTSSPALRDAGRILVTLADGSKLPARILDREVGGLAVIKVRSAKGLPALPLGRADRLRAGTMVVAAGSPYALEQSFSQGVISAVHRVLAPGQARDLSRQQLLQTDAAVNEGSGGGPLLDVNGRVVGVTVGVISPSGTNSGVAFAIPLDGRRLAFLARTLRKA